LVSVKRLQADPALRAVVRLHVVIVEPPLVVRAERPQRRHSTAVWASIRVKGVGSAQQANSTLAATRFTTDTLARADCRLPDEIGVGVVVVRVAGATETSAVPSYQGG